MIANFVFNYITAEMEPNIFKAGAHHVGETNAKPWSWKDSCSSKYY